MVILVSLIGLTLGALMLTMIVTQTRSTRFDTSRVRSLDAAQSGIDVALGQIRASISSAPTGADPSTGIYYGDPSTLPCGPINNTIANGTGTATYSVTIAYKTVDNSNWTCNSSAGAPGSAVITSKGTDGAAVNGASSGRTLTTTYFFRTNNPTLPPGGQFKIYPSSVGSPAFCLAAQSATPTAGTPIVAQPCTTASAQMFTYRSDLSIQLVSSMTVTNPAGITTASPGLCLDTSPTAHSSGVAVVLQSCTTSTQPPSNQEWGLDVYGHLVAWRADGTGYDSYCVSVASQVNGQLAKLSACSGSASDPTQTFLPTPSTGSGPAGALTNQIVSYQRANQCIDDTNADPNYAFLILYPCKQSSNPATVGWNQQFAPALGPPSATAPPVKGTLTMTNGTAYCLRAPPAVPNSPSYPTLTTSCTDNWTWQQVQDATGKTLAYADMYTITDSSGRCLGIGTEVFNTYPKLVLTACDGDSDQKWNADPRVLASASITTKEN